MKTTVGRTRETTAARDQHDFENYLPGMPQPSNDPGRVEQFLTTLFRRRGGFGVFSRSKSR